MKNELEQFLDAWDYEHQNTMKLMRALPREQYDYRPDPKGRSLGEMAWHLAEIDGYFSNMVATGKADFGTKLPNMERPRTVEALAPNFQKVHEDAVARVRQLKPEDLERKIPYFDGTTMPIGRMLWGPLLMHYIHHRGQLQLLGRMAGGTAPGMYGPNREESEAMKAKATAGKN